MWIKIDENGYILGHDYKETEEYNIKIGKQDIVDTSDYTYFYKYINNELVKLSEEEKLNQPQAIVNKMSNLRHKRNNLLRESDFSVLEDSPVDKQAWKEYRKALRDLTDNVDINNIIYPSKPGEIV